MAESSQNRDVLLTQAPTANLSTDDSLVYTHGASIAERAIKAKPRFAEFMCSHNEVDLLEH